MHPNGPPPLFAPAGGTSGKSSSKSRSSKKSKNLALPALNIDDVFGEIAFTPDGELEVKDELEIKSGEGRAVKTMASKVTNDGEFCAVAAGGGLYTTQLHQGDKPSLAMGAADGAAPSTSSVPYRKAPQADHQLEYAAPKKDKKKSSKDKDKSEKDAKRSKIRKKFLLESLQQSVALLKEDNERLRNSIRQHLGPGKADALINSKGGDDEDDMDGLMASSQGIANKVLDDPDFSFIKALQTAQQNFVVTDPSLPDNPIVYASQGFLNLTGYSLDQILGRNCRFLQGPETDPRSIGRIRKAIEEGCDMSVCLLNYRVDGGTFWNQFFIAALRDANGEVTNYVGVQCKVSDQYAATVTKQQDEDE
jgi:PAS domain S-box-containing protein